MLRCLCAILTISQLRNRGDVRDFINLKVDPKVLLRNGAPKRDLALLRRDGLVEVSVKEFVKEVPVRVKKANLRMMGLHETLSETGADLLQITPRQLECMIPLRKGGRPSRTYRGSSTYTRPRWRSAGSSEGSPRTYSPIGGIRICNDGFSTHIGGRLLRGEQRLIKRW